MTNKYFLLIAAALFAMFSLIAEHAEAQVTTSSISGIVIDQSGDPLPGATVVAVHEPSGTRYGTASQVNGRFTITGMRVGGPYSVTVSFIGFETKRVEGIELRLGVSSDLEIELRESSAELEEVVVLGQRGAILSSERTGASTSIGRESLDRLPTVSRSITDFTRLTPQASGNSFAGQDYRSNNFTVDGSAFNNQFGLGSTSEPGGRTGVPPISLDAIDQVQVNVAPFDVRQGRFVGAGVNSVTRSGTNEYTGSVYYQFTNNNLVGSEINGNPIDPGEFQDNMVGIRIGGPIIKDKLFFFTSFENQGIIAPGTTFRPNTGTEQVGGNVTRVLQSDLDQLSNFLATNFGYDTGPYTGYDNETPSTRFLAKLDYNLNDRNKFSLRYTHLDSQTDVLMSNSSSLGFGSRRTSTNAINPRNSNYIILENIRSIIGEWNSSIGDNMSNNMIIGYTYQDESRDSRGDFFPMVDILQDGSTYTSFGFEPFTPNNELRYKTFQFQNNFTMSRGDHIITLGGAMEYFESENVFFPGSQSAYVYNSLDDFYEDANDYLANPTRTTSPVEIRRFQVRWANQPGFDKPLQPLEVFSAGLFAQTEWRVTRNLGLTIGIRADVPFFGDTGFRNPEVEGLTFRDPDGNAVQFATDKLPDANILWSPRVGFNWDATGDRSTQVRGGTGIFSGPPAYVWISNQIGENGVLTGFEQLDNTTARPFHPDPDHYKPANVTGDPASSYGLAFTETDFKFPQIWRTNLAVDQQLPFFGLIGTFEVMYSRDVNGIAYYNANLSQPNDQYNGVDDRPRWVGGNRINPNVTSAIVLTNQNDGYYWNISASLEKPISEGFYGKLAYNYGIAKNTINPGSIAFGSWNNNQHTGNPNNPGVGFSSNTAGHRVFTALSYRREWFSFGATTLSLFWEGRTGGTASYTFSGSVTGASGFGADLIYIHNDVSEMNFSPITDGGGNVLFTSQQQAEAWDAFIEQDPYLSKNRGSYAQRNAARLPMEFFADLAVEQEFFTDLFNRRHALVFRADVVNVANLFSSKWGAGQRFVTTQPLIADGVDGNGVMQYQLRRVGDELIRESFEDTAGLGDVFQLQFTIRYLFN
jgi:hypothetical protein